LANKFSLRKLYVKKLSADNPPYKINENYQRFDQRNNLTVGRPNWDEGFKPYFKKSAETRSKKIKMGKTGYGVEDYSLFLSSGVSAFQMGNAINHANRGVTSWNSLGAKLPPGTGKWEGSPEEATKIVKKAAKYFGAQLVGIVPLNRDWFYSKSYWADGSHKDVVFEELDEPKETEDSLIIPEKMKWVIVMGIGMDPEMMGYTPSPLGCAETRISYSKMALMVSGMAEFLRGIGHQAIPSINDLALNIPMGIDAGFGEQGRNGKIISPEFGPSLRICKVITDLPLVRDYPISFGVKEFCEICMKCADDCPVGAIPSGDRSWSRDSISCGSGHYTWHLNNELCRRYWAMGNGTNCTSCIRSCPFTKKPGLVHEFSRTFISNAPSMSPLFKKVDDWLGYGKEKDGSTFWNS
jgi:epoxyqueuosine reductase